MKRICNFFTDNMAILVIAIGVVGALWPSTLAWVAPWISWMLGMIMFGMGMTLTFDDFRMLGKRPWEVCLGAAAQFTIMPLAAWLLVKIFSIPPEIAVGVVLLGTCPGGTASNVITYLAKGDVALSVAMTMTTTILAPVVTPILTWWLAGAWVEISLAAMMMSIAKMVLVPVVLGLLLNHFFGEKVRKVTPFLPVFSVIVIVLTIGGVVALSASKLFTYGLMITVVVICHNALGLLCGYIFARIFHLNTAKARALAIEVGMQNSGLAASLAIMHFTPAAAIPGAIFSVWHNISGSLVANYCVKQDAKAAELELEAKTA